MLTAHSAGPGVASVQVLGLTSGNKSAAYSRGEAQPVSLHRGIACAGSHSAGGGSRKAAAALNPPFQYLAKTQPKKPLLWQSLSADRTALCSTAPAQGFLPKHVGFPAVTWPVPRKVPTGASASCREKGARGTGKAPEEGSHGKGRAGYPTTETHHLSPHPLIQPHQAVVPCLMTVAAGLHRSRVSCRVLL